jgi:hypothetical protein
MRRFEPLPPGYDTRSPNRNRYALVALVLALVAVFFKVWGLVPLIGLILGIMALRERDQYGRRPRGMGLAIAAVTLAGAELVYSLFLLFVLILGTVLCGDSGALAHACSVHPERIPL